MRSGDFDLVPLSSDDSVDRHVLADFRYSFTHIADALNLLVNIDPDNHDYDYQLEVSQAKKLLREIKQYDEWDFFFSKKNHEHTFLPGEIENSWDFANVMSCVSIRESAIRFFPTYKLKKDDVT